MARQNNYPIFENNSTVITAEFLNGLVNNVKTLNQEDGVFDISIANAVSGVPTTYNSLELVIDGYGGESAAGNYTDLINLLQISTPKSIIWHPGGNNADTESAINDSWLEKWNAVAAICAEKDIELIGVAWPSMYGGFSEDNPEMNKFRNHTYQCTFIRQSGYKYIDLAEAVGADMATGLWYGTTAQDIIDKTNNGMLSSDGVHPTVSGALSMYHMAIACVPELTLLK